MQASDNILTQAYAAAELQKLLPQLAEFFEGRFAQRQAKTINWLPPAKQLRFWQQDFAAGEPESFAALADKLASHSIDFHNPGYMGHQVAVTLPVTFLTSALAAYLNNCTTVYELGMAGNAMEKVVISHLAEKFGYTDGATGFVASGGSLGNLTALVTARTSSGIGVQDYHRLAIMVSAEAHYSIERAARIMGLPEENIIKIPVDGKFSARTELLEELYQQAVSAGKIVFCIVGCACTTSVGAFDDLEAIAAFAEKRQIWFHVDGAHGGAAIFSEKHRHLLRGIERSDSLIVDFHKMMLTPPLSTAVIYNAGHKKINEFSPHAAYLWRDQLSEEWWNSAKHTLECTKPITIIHTYAIMKLYGDKIYQENVDTLFGLGESFAALLREQEDMELLLEPRSNIVCFRYLPPAGDIEELNRRLAARLLQDGSYYAVSTVAGGQFCLRVTFMNPFTTMEDMRGLLAKIRSLAAAEEAVL